MVLYARYSDILTGDTVTITAGVEDANYLKENIADRMSRTVGRFTGTSGTYRRTFGATKTPAGAFFLNTNATAIQLTNNAGLNVAASVPAVPPDGLPLDFGIDLRNEVDAAGTQFNAALTGPAGVGLGEFILVSTLRSVDALWSPEPIDEEGHPVSHEETDAGVDLDYGFGVRFRGGMLTFRDEDGRAAFLALERDQRGRLRPWMLLPYGTFSDVLFVKFVSDTMQLVTVAGSPTVAGAFVTDVAIHVKEMQKGLAL